MSKKVLTGSLSFLLAFSLLVPAVGAQGKDLQKAVEGKSIVPRLNHATIRPDFMNVGLQDVVNLQGKQRVSTQKSSGLSLSKSFTLEKQDSQVAEFKPENYVPHSESTKPITVIVELQEEPNKVFEASQNKLRTGLMNDSHKLTVNLQQQNFKQLVLGKMNAKIDREYSSVFNGFSLEIPANRVQELATIPGVKAIYPNSTVHATAAEATDPTVPGGSVPFIGSESLWNSGLHGEGIKVGIVDTGITKDHPDLAGAVHTGYWGYDFVNNDSEPYETTKTDFDQARRKNPSLPEFDEYGSPYYTAHGSHVAGIIAGQGVGANGQKGINGVAPEADVYAYKVLGPYGSGTTDDVIAGINKAVEDGMDVINLSLGSDENDEKSADSVAINNAVKAGVVAAVAAGNAGPNAETLGSPGAAERALTVAACSVQNDLASFSSRGPALPSHKIKPDITAPGVAIYSSVPDYEGYYASWDGTSMATPHIAGAAALLTQKYPNLDPDTIKSLMMNNTVQLSNRSGSRYTYMDQGAGRVALDKVLNARAVAMSEDTFTNNNQQIAYRTGSISFGTVNTGVAAQRKVVVKDIIGQNSNYSVTANWFDQAAGSITLSATQVSVPANGEASLNVGITLPANATAQRYEGVLTLTEASSGHVINMPIAVYRGNGGTTTPPSDSTDIVSDLMLDPDIFSPNADGSADTTNISFSLNQYEQYFSLDVYNTNNTWLGTIVEEDTGLEPGNYSLSNWNGTYVNSRGKTTKLTDGKYQLVPFVGSSVDSANPVEDQLSQFIVDTKAPVVTLNAIKADKTKKTATITGKVTSDLMIDLLVKTGMLPMNQVIGAAALYDNDRNGQWEQADGVIDSAGNFTITVPLISGNNSFEVYVYDLAYNGVASPVNTLTYRLTSTLNNSESVTNDVYANDSSVQVTLPEE